MSQNEIEQNLEEKGKVLLWLIENKVRDLENFGRVMNLYYSNKEELLKDISNNNLKKILGIKEESKKPIKKEEKSKKQSPPHKKA